MVSALDLVLEHHLAGVSEDSVAAKYQKSVPKVTYVRDCLP